MVAIPKRKQTQWAAQFLVAGELARREYVVSFTMGNHTPVADLTVGNKKVQFWVDVKGNSAKRGWFAREKLPHAQLFYILVGVGKERGEDQFFILSQEQFTELIRKDRLEHPNQKPGWGGVNWRDAIPFSEAWDSLPN